MTRVARPLLWPLVPAYRLALALREIQLRTGLKPVRRLGWSVVSVGNLSAGGAGKTPLTIALARALAARGVHVDVLSRGYGRRSALPLLVEPEGTAEDFGDEPLMIAREAGIPVFVAAERYAAGLLAEADAERSEMEPHPSDKGKDVARVGRPSNRQAGEPASEPVCAHLLDDGFQHRQLHRDVNILLLSREDLNDHLLPAGNLREPLHSAERADVIAIPADQPDLADWLKARDWDRPIWRLRRRMDVPRIDGPAVAFCGIARPEQFFAGLERAGVRLASRFAFRDHHRYTAGDLEQIVAAARRMKARALLATEKDGVRLGGMAESLAAEIPLKIVPLGIEIEDESAAIDWLAARIRRAK